jgi:hypothetical protein
MMSLRPKNWLKPLPALVEGVVASSTMATPLVAVVVFRLSSPLAKVAVAVPPRAVFSWVRKLVLVKVGPAAPLTVMVRPAGPKSMSTRWTMAPAALVMAIVVLPVKLAKAVLASRPVSLPVMLFGAGTELAALEARFSSSAARLTNSPSWSERLGSSLLRSSSRPWISPLVTASGMTWPPLLAVTTVR